MFWCYHGDYHNSTNWCHNRSTMATINRKYTWLHFLLLPLSGYSIWGTENWLNNVTKLSTNIWPLRYYYDLVLTFFRMMPLMMLTLMTLMLNNVSSAWIIFGQASTSRHWSVATSFMNMSVPVHIYTWRSRLFDIWEGGVGGCMVFCGEKNTVQLAI